MGKYQGRSHKQAGISKRISEPFYPNDWMGDDELQMASITARGVWIECLCRMWRNKTYKIEGTEKELATLFRASLSDVRKFISEAERYKFADVAKCRQNVATVVAIVSRRLKKRVHKRLQKQKERVGKNVATVVEAKKALPSSSSSSSSLSYERERGENGAASVSVGGMPPLAEKRLSDCRSRYGEDPNGWPPDAREILKEMERANATGTGAPERPAGRDGAPGVDDAGPSSGRRDAGTGQG